MKSFWWNFEVKNILSLDRIKLASEWFIPR